MQTFQKPELLKKYYLTMVKLENNKKKTSRNTLNA